MIILYALLSVVLVSCISLIGVVYLFFKEAQLRRFLMYVVGFAIGALLGDVFIHILPETSQSIRLTITGGLLILAGFFFFFSLERYIHWRHCHIPTSHGHPHPVAYNNLIGDALHNFVDGVLIGGSYLASIPVGIATTVAVALHEIPQEIGDFGILIHAGFTRRKALMVNFFSAIMAVLGAILALLIGTRIGLFAAYLLPLSAGGLLYIAAADLIPELHKNTCETRSLPQFAAIILGIGVMLALTLI